MFCTNCGKKIDDECRFCIYCGKTIAVNRGAEPAGRSAFPKAEDVHWPDDEASYGGSSSRYDGGGYEGTPAGPSVSFNTKDLDIKLGYAGAAVTAISVFFSFITAEGMGISLMSEYIGNLGIIFLLYAIIAGAGLFINQKAVFVAMTLSILIFVIFLSSLLGKLGVVFGEYVNRGAGFWLLIIGLILMVASTVMILMKKYGNGRR